jgi:hypothetical protein
MDQISSIPMLILRNQEPLLGHLRMYSTSCYCPLSYCVIELLASDAYYTKFAILDITI